MPTGENMKKVLKKLGLIAMASLLALFTASTDIASIEAYAEDAPELVFASAEVGYRDIRLAFANPSDELYSIVQKGITVTIGDKTVTYEGRYWDIGNNEKGTFIKSGKKHKKM